MDDFAPGPPKEVIYENTFITEPEGYGEVRANVALSGPINCSKAQLVQVPCLSRLGSAGGALQACSVTGLSIDWLHWTGTAPFPALETSRSVFETPGPEATGGQDPQRGKGAHRRADEKSAV